MTSTTTDHELRHLAELSERAEAARRDFHDAVADRDNLIRRLRASGHSPAGLAQHARTSQQYVSKVAPPKEKA